MTRRRWIFEEHLWFALNSLSNFGQLGELQSCLSSRMSTAEWRDIEIFSQRLPLHQVGFAGMCWNILPQRRSEATCSSNTCLCGTCSRGCFASEFTSALLFQIFQEAKHCLLGEFGEVRVGDDEGLPLHFITCVELRQFSAGVPFCFSIASQERTLTWTALTSSVKKHRHRRRSHFTSAFVSEKWNSIGQHWTAWNSMEWLCWTWKHMETGSKMRQWTGHQGQLGHREQLTWRRKSGCWAATGFQDVPSLRATCASCQHVEVEKCVTFALFCTHVNISLNLCSRIHLVHLMSDESDWAKRNHLPMLDRFVVTKASFWLKSLSLVFFCWFRCNSPRWRAPSCEGVKKCATFVVRKCAKVSLHLFSCVLE